MAATAAGIRAGKAYVEIGTMDSGLTKGLRAAREKVQSFGKSISEMGTTLAAAGAGIVAPLALAVKQFIDFGSQLDDMSKKTGFSVETLSELKFVSDQSGSSLEDIEKAAKKMASTLLDAKDGSDAASDALARLGLSAGILLQMSPEDQFFAIATALSEVDDATTKAALAQDIFGRAGTNLLPMLAEGADGMAALREEAKRLGVTMSKEDAQAAETLGDAFGSLTAAFGSAFRQIGAELAPALQGIAEDMTRLLPHIREFIRDNGEWVVQLAKIATGLLAVGGAMKALGTTLAVVTATNPWILLAAAIAGAVVQLSKLNDEAANFSSWERNLLKKLFPGQAGWIDFLLGGDRAGAARNTAARATAADEAEKGRAAEVDAAMNGFVVSLDDVTTALNGNIDGFDLHTQEMIESLAAAKRLRAAMDAEEQARLDAMETDARIQEIERDGILNMIDHIEGLIDNAQMLSDAGSRRAGMAIAGSSEFAQAIAEHMAPKQDDQLSLLKQQLEEEKKALRALDKIVEQGRDAPRLGVIN